MSRQINLYDPSFRPKRDLLSAHNLLLGSLLAVFVVSMGAMATRWSIAKQSQQAKSINEQLLGERAAFASLAGLLGSRKADPALQQEVADLESGVQGARSALLLLRNMTSQQTTPVVGEMMRAFGRVSLDGLWLTGFVVQDGGKQLEIRGRMVDQALLPNYLKRLEAEPVFHGRRFSALDMKGGEWLPPPVPGSSAPVPGVALGGAPGTAPAAPAGRWYIDFALRTQRDEKALAAGSGQ